jgi:periplasmic divalent cation tolerance protein
VSASYSIALTTAATDAKAREIAVAALEAKLAGCAQLFPIRSHYVWKSALCEEAEVALHLKIRSEDFGALVALIRAMHDYETPEILKVDIADGDTAYLDWLADATQK